MAYETAGTDITLIAAADQSTSQYRAIKVDTAEKGAVAGAGEFAIGVLQNKPAAGEAATVRVAGVTKMVAGAAVAAGARVAPDAAGKAKTAVAATVNTSDAGAASDAVTASHVLGIALEAAAADGDIISVLITHSGAAPTTAA